MQSMGQTAGETATLSFVTCAVPAWRLCFADNGSSPSDTRASSESLIQHLSSTQTKHVNIFAQHQSRNTATSAERAQDTLDRFLSSSPVSLPQNDHANAQSSIAQHEAHARRAIERFEKEMRK
jgi:hypothetical protein